MLSLSFLLSLGLSYSTIVLSCMEDFIAKRTLQVRYTFAMADKDAFLKCTIYIF